VLVAEEALHPLVEAGDPALESPLGGRAGLQCATRRRATEEHQRADQLVVPLVRRRGIGCMPQDVLRRQPTTTTRSESILRRGFFCESRFSVYPPNYR
jgi:hypothetical protein